MLFEEMITYHRKLTLSQIDIAISLFNQNKIEEFHIKQQKLMRGSFIVTYTVLEPNVISIVPINKGTKADIIKTLNNIKKDLLFIKDLELSYERKTDTFFFSYAYKNSF